MKDVHNLCSQVGKETSSLDNVMAKIQEFQSTERMVAGDDGTIKCLYIQTKQMQDHFAQFPEVIFVDSTHNTNYENYYLFGVYGHSVMGNAVPLFLSLNYQNTTEILNEVMRIANEINPTLKDVQVAIMDKDMQENAVIRKFCPKVITLLCQWHVIAYMDKVMTDNPYYVDPSSRQTIKDIIHDIIYADTPEKYDEYSQELLANLGSEAHVFWVYWKENWDSCKRRWCTAWRDQTFNMGNGTNNRLESNWKVLKAFFPLGSGICRCFEGYVNI
jgi:hypothetical protein